MGFTEMSSHLKKTRLNLDPALPKGVEMVGDTGGGGVASSNDGLAHR